MLYQITEYNTKFALTLDIWTASNQNAFLGVTIHYINKQFKYLSILLTIEELTVKHSGPNIFLVLRNIIENFGIEHSIIRYLYIYIYKYIYIYNN